MRFTPIKLACVCLVGTALWLSILYLVNRFLQWPVGLSYGLFTVLSAAVLYYLLQRHRYALQYLRVFDKHPIPMWIYEYGTLRFLTVNQAAIEKYGYSKKEFQSLTIMDIRDPAEIDKLMENIRLHCNGTQYRGIWKHRKKNGTDFYVELYGHDGTYLGRKTRIIMAVDVDEQIKESMEARELGVRYDLLAKATNDAIYDWDAVNNSVVWNHGLYTLFGYQPHAAASSTAWWEEKLHPEDRERVLTSLQQKLEGTENYYEEQYRLLCADGRYKYALGRGYIIRENKVAVRMIGLIQDLDHIVEKKQVIQRLQEQNKGLREIAWMNSHEIRRPVVSILGITQLFDKSHENKSLNNQLIEWLYTSTSQLDEIIHKLEEKVREIENGNEN